MYFHYFFGTQFKAKKFIAPDIAPKTLLFFNAGSAILIALAAAEAPVTTNGPNVVISPIIAATLILSDPLLV